MKGCTSAASALSASGAAAAKRRRNDSPLPRSKGSTPRTSPPSPPGVHRRGRRELQRGPERRAGEEQRERLHRLAQAHVVGEAGAGAPLGQARQPAKPLGLIIAQLGAEALGQRDRLLARLCE